MDEKTKKESLRMLENISIGTDLLRQEIKKDNSDNISKHLSSVELFLLELQKLQNYEDYLVERDIK